MKRPDSGHRLTRDRMSSALFRRLVRHGIVLAHRFPRFRALVKGLVPRRLRNWILMRGQPHGLDASSQAAAARVPPSASPVPMANNRREPERMDVLCFANIDWSARFQRPQQLMSQFARHGYRVFYIVASKRPPRGEAYGILEVAEGVFEVSLPFAVTDNFYSEVMHPRNVAPLADALGALCRDFRIKTAISVLHLPYWRPLALHLRTTRAWRMQYDCMDDWVDFPHMSSQTLAEEERLVAEADVVTVTASLLHEKWAARAKTCVLVRNGVDFDFFSQYCAPNELLAALPRPIIGFYGALAEWIDLDLIATVAKLRPDWSFVLVGDVFVNDLRGLDEMPNVHLPGRKPYGDMPRYLYHFDVCLIPFRLYNVTHAVDPVKFYEFISAGKPVVSTPLEEMQIYRDLVYFADGPTAFVEQIAVALAENDRALEMQRIEVARGNDWKRRFESTLNCLEALHPKVSVIVVTFNNVAMTAECIESLLRNTTYPVWELIVVDNASSDDTRNYLRHMSRREARISIVLNNENRGFAAANNQGLRQATGQYMVLLNNDTVVPKGWVDPLLRHLADPGVGLVGPVTNSVGNEARVAVDYADWAEMEGFADRYTAQHADRIFDIAMLAMFCVAMRREVFERIGPLDEAFGIGMFEDDDYSRRVQAAGLRTVCAEDCFIHHHGQASFKKLIASGHYQALWDKNQAYFESKWGSWKPHEHRPPAKHASRPTTTPA